MKARSQVLGMGENTYLGIIGSKICFLLYVENKVFSPQQNWGVTGPGCSPWLRAWVDVHLFKLFKQKYETPPR